MILHPVLQFVIHSYVLTEQPVEILTRIIFGISGPAAKIHKAVQAILGKADVELDALRRVLLLAELVLFVVAEDVWPLGLRGGGP